MKGLSYLWRMALRRKAACLLVTLFTLAATIFMLVYPSLIRSTSQRLAEAYESLEVTGWMLNSADYDDPTIPGDKWKELESSGYFSELSASNQFQIQAYNKAALEAQAGENANDKQRLKAFQGLMASYVPKENGAVNGRMNAYNRFAASDELVRAKDSIQWLDGYDESCLKGDEHICILSEDWGYKPGDMIPMLANYRLDADKDMQGIICMKVVGTYKGKITAFAAVMPLKVQEELCTVATEAHKQAGNSMTWPYTLSSLLFTIKDNYQLDEVKQYLVDQGFDGSNGVRAAVDDRIFKGTVSPIESNLALLEGLYSFFFLMVTAIGFFLSFLLARGRKPEYAVMRMLGERRLQITLKALCEQFALCLAGVLLGAGAVALVAEDSLNPYICGVILLCYTLGAAIAVLLTVRVNVMEILRDKE